MALNPILPTLKYLAPEYLVFAVMEAYHYNNYTSVFSGSRADDINWVTHADMRADLTQRVRSHWAGVTKKDFTFFPYTESYVCKLYWRLMQRTEEERAQWEREICHATGQPEIPAYGQRADNPVPVKTSRGSRTRPKFA